MVKFPGANHLNVAVFISGAGTNLKSLIKFSLKTKKKIIIKLIISNNKKAKGLKYSKIFKIKKKIYNFDDRNNEENILNFLEYNQIDIICLAGFMKILSTKFIKKFKGKIINIHPSLLPKYKGLNTHQRVLDNNDNFSGCTVHYVNSKLDSGRIILQKKVKVLKRDTAKTLAKRILKQEHILYPMALKKICINL